MITRITGSGPPTAEEHSVMEMGDRGNPHFGWSSAVNEWSRPFFTESTGNSQLRDDVCDNNIRTWIRDIYSELYTNYIFTLGYMYTGTILSMIFYSTLSSARTRCIAHL